MNVIDLAGTPRQMGRQYGEALREQTRAFADIRLDRCVVEARQMGLPVDGRFVLDVCTRCVDHTIVIMMKPSGRRWPASPKGQGSRPK